jgi:hypothetical protein
MADRIHWAQAQAIIEKFAGPVSSAREVGEGLNAEIAVIINQRFFVKGLRLDHPWIRAQIRERDINPFIRHVSSALEWHAEEDGWSLLGFEYLPGRAPEYRPGSPDLTLIADMMTRLPPAPPDLDLKLAEQRWSPYSHDASLFAGNHLSHTDWSPGNVLISDATRIVDWAWPTRSADWIDPACWVVWLIASGHDPAEAEQVAATVTAFASAPANAVTAFAAMQAAMWTDIGDKAPHPGLAAAAASWHAHRAPS